MNTLTGKEYAIKQVLVHDDMMFEKIDGEIKILKILHGKEKIVKIISATAHPSPKPNFGFIKIVLELGQESLGKALQKRMEKSKPTHIEILKIFIEMCKAVAEIHGNEPPIIHRDLKLEDFVYFDGVLKLCDFGSAIDSSVPLNYDNIEEIRLDILEYTSLPYKSPEMINIDKTNPIGIKTDIWNLGCLLYKLFYGVHPFEGKSDVYIMNGVYKFPEKPSVATDIKVLIKEILKLKAELRPSAEKLISTVKIMIQKLEAEEEERSALEIKLKIEGVSKDTLSPRRDENQVLSPRRYILSSLGDKPVLSPREGNSPSVSPRESQELSNHEIKKMSSLSNFKKWDANKVKKRSSFEDKEDVKQTFDTVLLTPRGKSKKELPKIPEILPVHEIHNRSISYGGENTKKGLPELPKMKMKQKLF